MRLRRGAPDPDGPMERRRPAPEGFRCLLIEKDAGSVRLVEARMARVLSISKS